MSGIFDFLVNGTQPATQVTGGTSTKSLPPWYEDYQRNLLAAGLSTANEPFQLYPNERIALPTPNVEGAWAGAGQFGRDVLASPLSQVATEATTRGAAPFDPEQLKTFMNPYSEQVADIIGRRGEERYRDKFLDPVMDAFTSGGQFGSQRNMDFARKAMEDASREITDAQTQALSTGYGQGLQGYEQFQQLAQAGGGQAQNQLRGALEMMEAAGVGEQGQYQKSYDQAYKDFVEQRDYPWTELAKLKELGGNISLPSTTTETASGPASVPAGASPLEILSGILASIAGTNKTTTTT